MRLTHYFFYSAKMRRLIAVINLRISKNELFLGQFGIQNVEIKWNQLSHSFFRIAEIQWSSEFRDSEKRTEGKIDNLLLWAPRIWKPNDDEILCHAHQKWPVNCWIKYLAHVLPDPGEDARAVRGPGGSKNFSGPLHHFPDIFLSSFVST